jgi:hypothetical protein
MRMILPLMYVALFTSCSKKIPPKTVVVLFDLSESVNKEEVIKSDQDGFQKILAKVNQGDIVVGERILESSLAQSTLPINRKIPPFVSSNDNPLLVKKEKKIADEELNKMKEEIYRDVETLLLRKNLKRKILKTDILSSLHIVERVFKAYENERNILVIFSDMIEDSDNYNFEKEMLLPERIEAILSKEKKQGRMPDLTGVKVYIVGARSHNTNQFFSIQNFWLAYFKDCGADVKNYGALIDFNE